MVQSERYLVFVTKYQSKIRRQTTARIIIVRHQKRLGNPEPFLFMI